MSDINVRSDAVDVEQIMQQIRARIREKRGADYTEAELQQLASAKLERFADPSGLRSDLLEQFRAKADQPSTYHRHRGFRRLVTMLMHPFLKRIQKQLMADFHLYFEIIHNLVVEVTRLGIEVHNLKMRVESLSSRLDFDERRARAFEGVVQYRQGAPQRARHEAAAPAPSPAGTGGGRPAAAPDVATTAAPGGGGPGTPVPGQPQPQGGRPDGGRRRRRRRRRRPGQTLAESPAGGAGGSVPPSGPQNGGGNGGPTGGGPDGDDEPFDDEGASDQ